MLWWKVNKWICKLADYFQGSTTICGTGQVPPLSRWKGRFRGGQSSWWLPPRLSQWLQACSRRRKIVTRLLCVHFIENWVGGGNKWINNIVQIFNFWGKISPFESLQDAEKASIRPIKHCYWCKLPPWYVWGSFWASRCIIWGNWKFLPVRTLF